MLSYRLTCGELSIDLSARNTVEAFEQGFEHFGLRGFCCICLSRLQSHPH